MKYAIIIEKTEEGTFGAYAPDLPGVGVTGATADEVRELLRDAVALHIESMQADGEEVPLPTAQIEYIESPAA